MKHDWEYKKLGEVGTIITGSTPPTSNPKNYESKDICFVKPSDIEKEGITHISKAENYISNYAYNNSCRRLPKGSVLITCIGIIGKVGILEVDATCNQQINALVPKEELSSKYIAYALLSIKELMQSVANAPVVPIINKGQFSSFCIPLPALAVQERIVGELDKVREVIEKKKEQLKELERLAGAMFYDMFGDPVENEKGWEVKRFKDSCKRLYAGGDVPKDDFSKEQTSKYTIPIFSNGVERKGLYGYTSTPRETQPCITIAGRGTIGYCVIRTTPFFPIIRLIVAVPDNNLNVHYFKYLVDTLSFKGNGGAIPQLTIPMIKDREIPIPPLSLQQAFAEKVEGIEKQKELITASLKEAETLFDARMEYWFGE